MSERVPMVCENCGRDLWIRLRNVGRIGKCKYCGYLFRARIDEIFDLQPTPLSRVAEAADESRGLQDDSRQRLARESMAVLPQDQPARASDHLEPAADRSVPSERRWEAAHSPISEFRAELTALRDRANQVDQLKQRLETELDEIEQIRARIQEAHSHPIDPEAQADLERANDLEALRDECNRFRDEAQGLRAQMEVQAAEEKARSENLTRECEAACAERERRGAQLEAQAREFERSRHQFGAEREALIREVEQLQNKLEGLERAQDDAEYEHHQACSAWVEERQELEAWSEHQRQELVEAEQRSTEQQAQFKAERQAWDQQRDELARRIAADETRLLEAEQLQARTAHDRDDRAQEVERLANRLADLERARVAAEAEWVAARAAWETDREQLQTQAERQRQELIDDAERRLDERRAQYEAERQAWDQQRDELARRIAADETRLLEAEQLQARTAHDRDDRAQEVERLANRLADLERARVTAEAEWVAARAAWEADRELLQTQAERQRQELIDAERRLDERQAQFEAEQQVWDQQRDEHAQLAAIWESLAQEVEQVQSGLLSDRDALARDVEGLRVRLAETEDSRTNAETRFDEARAGWAAERQTWDQQRDELERRIAADETRLLEAEQLQARTTHDQDDRAQEVERLAERLADLERARVAAEAEWVAARAAWEADRELLQTQAERQRQELLEDAERRLAELRTQLEAEPQASGHSVEAGREREPLQQEAEEVRELLNVSRQERDAALQQVEAAIRERDLLCKRIEEAEAGYRDAERRGKADSDRLSAALDQVRRESTTTAHLSATQAEVIRRLRAELERQRTDRGVRDEEREKSVAALRRAWEVERRRWVELLAAAHPNSPTEDPAHRSGLPFPPREDFLERSTTPRVPVAKSQDGGSSAGIGAIAPTTRRQGGASRRRGVATPLRARPQASSYHDAETFRSQLEQWMAEAQARLQNINAPPGRSGNEASLTWLEFEIRTAREEITLLEQSRIPDPTEPGEPSPVHLDQP